MHGVTNQHLLDGIEEYTIKGAEPLKKKKIIGPTSTLDQLAIGKQYN